jgi:hypothetical protein
VSARTGDWPRITVEGSIALDDYLAATEAAVTMEDSWGGLTHYVQTATSFGPCSLAAVAAPSRSRPRWDTDAPCDDAVEALVARSHRVGYSETT